MLSGLLRDNSSYASLKRDVIDAYAADVYCQHSYTHEHSKAAQADIINNCYDPIQLLQQPDVNSGNNFTQRLHPNLHHLAPFHAAYDGNRHNQILAQLQDMKTAANMFDWSKYDFIIRARYDKINLKAFPDLNKLHADTFYADCCWNCWFLYSDKLFIDRNFILPNTMKHMCEGFDLLHNTEFCANMYNWAAAECGSNFSIDFWPEYLLAYMFTYYGLQHKFKKLSCEEYHIAT
jgi:hypothetical protein